MAQMKFDGVSDYVKELQKISDESLPVIKQAVYAGAGIVADEVRSEISALPVGGPEKITKKQKEGLLNSLGVTKMQTENGYTNVKIGFTGYNTEKTEKYKNGKPNAMIARAIVSGTSFSQKNDFIGKAVKNSKQQAENEMVRVFDEKIRALKEE